MTTSTNEINNATVAQLKIYAEKYGVKKTGTKDELRKRILEAAAKTEDAPKKKKKAKKEPRVRLDGKAYETPVIVDDNSICFLADGVWYDTGLCPKEFATSVLQMENAVSFQKTTCRVNDKNHTSPRRDIQVCVTRRGLLDGDELQTLSDATPAMIKALKRNATEARKES